MKRHVWGKQRDANEPDIVRALEQVHATVHELHAPVDLLVGWRGVNWLLEVKDGRKIPAHRALTAEQVEFFQLWRGSRAVVRSPAEALCVIGAKPCPTRVLASAPTVRCGCGDITDPPWFTEARAADGVARRKSRRRT